MSSRKKRKVKDVDPAFAEISAKISMAVQRLATQIEEGQSESLLSYLKTMAQFHEYSFWNVVLIRSARANATRVAGRRTWKTLGRQIKPHAEPIWIFVPDLPSWMFRLPAHEKKRVPNPRFIQGKVFDVADTEGKPLPKYQGIKGNPEELLYRLKAITEKRGIGIERRPALAFPPEIDQIKIRCAPSLVEEVDIMSREIAGRKFFILTHELARELLCQRRERAKKDRKIVVETEADAVAYVVSLAIGLDPGITSSDYIQLYNGDAKTLRDSLSCIQRTARTILAEICAGFPLSAVDC